IWQEPLQY
ncbi:cytosol aminopeptidase family, catalytic domain protein, partial [Chlamydia psittaci 02DC22]